MLTVATRNTVRNAGKVITHIYLHECGRKVTLVFGTGCIAVTEVENLSRVSEGAFETDMEDSNSRVSRVTLPSRMAIFREHQ